MTGVQAQTLKSLRLAGATPVVAGQQASLEIELSPAGGSVWCGLRVDFGDGAARELRVGENGAADLQLRIPLRYAAPGEYMIKVSGRMMSRGLRSATA